MKIKSHIVTEEDGYDDDEKIYTYIWVHRGARNMQENLSEELTDEKFGLDETLGTCECHNSWKLSMAKKRLLYLGYFIGSYHIFYSLFMGLRTYQLETNCFH